MWHMLSCCIIFWVSVNALSWLCIMRMNGMRSKVRARLLYIVLFFVRCNFLFFVRWQWRWRWRRVDGACRWKEVIHTTWCMPAGATRLLFDSNETRARWDGCFMGVFHLHIITHRWPCVPYITGQLLGMITSFRKLLFLVGFLFFWYY